MSNLWSEFKYKICTLILTHLKYTDIMTYTYFSSFVINFKILVIVS